MYHKIKSPFVRDPETKKLSSVFVTDEFRYLKNNGWTWTEKIDGMNIRIIWDGHRVTFAGRTDKALIPSGLVNVLNEYFGGEENETLFEQKFGDAPVTLYGEGIGEKIQSTKYGKEFRFILFDVKIGNTYLEQGNVEDIAKYFGVPTAPILFIGDIDDAVCFVRTSPKSGLGDCVIEGVVGRPGVGLLDRNGNRMIMKVKVRDFAA